MTTTIKTNNVPRNLIYGYELTDAQKSDFDYIDDIDSHDFFIYKGQVYDPSEFIRAPADLSPWQGVASDSYFSATLIRYTEDCEQVIVGRMYS